MHYQWAIIKGEILHWTIIHSEVVLLDRTSLDPYQA